MEGHKLLLLTDDAQRSLIHQHVLRVDHYLGANGVICETLTKFKVFSYLCVSVSHDKLLQDSLSLHNQLNDSLGTSVNESF